ncbi:NAD(P)H-dependent oxidoreductase [Microbulbifer sp. CAU 1566]|uniref:FMN-dependent NADH-azoreductase n=1 Tax=Microbulbifer sp. CAU 1566 TaxID=2933269 RepID=UPI002002EAD3|nr:NAD(P)H-dependent oxidoreductase [Microbulbifer sp. CAU 1566]MCK7598665.1 NAD(P)H-dependent oxidoreductase [Microbulbifer sp. CAU 1566]
MKKILKIDTSARALDNETASYRSLSRQLAAHFQQQWLEHNESDNFIHRDVGATPPGFVSQNWIAGVFTPEEKRNKEQQALLSLSEQLIAEVAMADLILISTPMYNYGMPASLKAWFDQVVRVNKTFTFDLARGDFPLQPVFSGKTLVLLTSSGEFGFGPGGIRESMNHLGPHIRTLSHYLGVENFYEIGIEYQEFGDERHQRSIENAYRAVDQLVVRLSTVDSEPVASTGA